MSDAFQYHSSGLESPATRHFAIIPSNSADLANVPRAIYVGTGGDLRLRDASGQDVTYTVVSGAVLPFRAVRVLASGTTAAGLVGWY